MVVTAVVLSRIDTSATTGLVSRLAQEGSIVEDEAVLSSGVVAECSYSTSKMNTAGIVKC